MEQTPIKTVEEILYKNSHDTSEGMVIQFDYIHHLISELKERDKQIAAKSWDAAYNWTYQEDYGAIPNKYPNKEEYLNSLVKKVEVKWEENTNTPK